VCVQAQVSAVRNDGTESIFNDCNKAKRNIYSGLPKLPYKSSPSAASPPPRTAA
jgi:hypothetical protein